MRFPALRWLAAAALLVAAVAPSQASSLERARAEALERLYLLEGPSLPLSAVYNALPEARRHAMLGKLRDMILAQLPPGFLEDPRLDALPPDARAMMARVLPLLRAVTPAQLDAVVRTLDLDHLAPLPPALFQAYHQKAMAEPVPGGRRTRGEVVAADKRDLSWRDEVLASRGYLAEPGTAPRTLELLGAGDAVPEDEVPTAIEAPALGGLGVSPSYPVDLPAHVLVNSARLADAFNHLANESYRDRPLEVRIGARSLEARDAVGLVNALHATGRFDVVVLDARMFVNFLDLWVPHQGTLLPVRIPSWMATGVKVPPGAPGAGGQLLIPANHSEHLLAVFEAGTTTPFALTRWYMGIPGSGPAQGTTFRPATWKRTGWSGYRVVNVYAGRDAGRQFVRAATRLMKLFNFMQGRLAFERNGYATIGVCNDTSGLMEGVLMGRTGRSTVWPLIRDPGLDFYYAATVGSLGLRLQDGAGGTSVLSIPSDARPDHYPWLAERRVHLHRLGANVPSRDPGTLQLPALRAWLSGLAGRSEVFARSLGMLRIEER